MAIPLLAFPDVSVVSCIAVYPTVGGVLTAVDIFGVPVAARFFAVAVVLLLTFSSGFPLVAFGPSASVRAPAVVGVHVSCCWRSCCCWRTFFC
jgi:hypothetical protein